MVESDLPIHLPPQTPTKTRNFAIFAPSKKKKKAGGWGGGGEGGEGADLKQLAEEPHSYQSL